MIPTFPPAPLEPNPAPAPEVSGDVKPRVLNSWSTPERPAAFALDCNSAATETISTGWNRAISRWQSLTASSTDLDQAKPKAVQIAIPKNGGNRPQFQLSLSRVQPRLA